MKKKSASQSAFFNPRVLIDFVLCSIGVSLALAGWSKSVMGTVRHEATNQTPGTWTATGSMSVARASFTATLLPNGKVLVAGGCTQPLVLCHDGIASAELYDPSTGIWTPTASMTTPRVSHTATLLPNGKVLVTGGENDLVGFSTAELYDPSAGTWTPTGSMNTPRVSHTATLINGGPLSGMVLVAGGSSVCAGCLPVLDSAELYDSSTGIWSYTGSTTLARAFGGQSSATLPDGSVLVVGGVTCCPYHLFNEAETYDQVSQTWTPTDAKMTTANGATILLPDRRVLVAGGARGTQPNIVTVATAELFDFFAATWTGTGSMSTDRDAHRLKVLPSGQVLVAGGYSGGFGVCNDLTSAELYDSSSGTWSLTGSMNVARNRFTATLLPNGQVLTAGGANCEENRLSSAELYTPPTGTVNPVPLINQPLVPDAVAPGGAGFTLTVNGTGFVSGSVVNWNGSARATTFVSSSQLTATILASDIATDSTASVTVVNPSPGGGNSNVVFFTITLPTSTVSLSRSDYATGSGPYMVVTADFNVDGKLDLAITNEVSQTVSILLGNGDGTFQPHVDFPTSHLAAMMIGGDFNGDGKLDLAVANGFESNTVSVLLGNGDGTFTAAVDYATGSVPVWLTTGDFNADGKLDLAVADFGNFDGRKVSILVGNGDGTFGPHVDYATGGLPRSVTTSDFNGDGKLDLALPNQAHNTVSILLGNGDGTFQRHTDYATGATAQIVTTGDFDADGNLDLAVTTDGSNAVSILLGNGDGTFPTHVEYATGSGAFHIAIADLNGDGKLDLAVNGVSLNVLLGNGDGTFQSHVEYGVGSGPVGVTIGDFNGDGRLDLAEANFNDNTVSVLLQGTTVALSDTSLDFGLQLVGTASSPQAVTLTNTGPIALNISSISASGDFLQRNNCGSSLPAGESCTIRITFNPTDKGIRTGDVTITDDAGDSPQVIALSGYRHGRAIDSVELELRPSKSGHHQST